MKHQSPSGYFNQTYTVEYTIPGSLDGVTLVPLNIAVPSIDNNDDPQQFYRPEVEDNAGLFDVDYVVNEFNRRGATATRIIHQIWLVSPVPGAAFAEIQVVDSVDGATIVQEVVDSLAGLTTYYRTVPPVEVPQGSLLRITGFENPGIEPIRLRLTIQFADDLLLVAQALCACTGIGDISIENEGVFIAATSILNFEGGGVLVTNDPANNRVNITIGGGGGPPPGGVPNALAVGQAGAAGVSLAYARMDHDHAVPDGTPVTVTGVTNSNGVATTFARSDHQHALAVTVQDENVAVASQPILNFLGAGVTAVNDGGSNRINITIAGASPGGVPDQLDVGQVGAAGVSALFAREDHVHAVPAGTPVTVAQANSAGVATTFARSDHVHRTLVEIENNGAFFGARPTLNITGAGAPTLILDVPGDDIELQFNNGPGGVPDGLDVGQVGAAGVSVLYSRADHVHAVPDGTPVTVTGITNSNGVATTFARSDHQHALGLAVQDEAVLAGTRAILNFTGAGVTATDDAGNNRVNITIPGGGATETWAQTLAAGNVSGGTDAVMSITDTFRGVDSAAAGTNGGVLSIRSGNYTGAGAGTDVGGALTVAGGSSNATGAGAMPTATFRAGDQTGTGGQTAGDLLVRAGDKTGAARGGNLVVRSGQATNVSGSASTAEFAAGNLVTSGNTAGAATLHGGDQITGDVGANGSGGFALIRGGDAPTAGSVRNGSGGHANIRGGNYRIGVAGVGSLPGNVFIRSGQPDNTSVAGTTGDIRITTNANATIGDMPSVSQTLTPTGSVQIDTIGPGATASLSGTITLQTGNVAGATGNLPGNIILVAGNMAQSGQSNVGGASITGTAGNSNGNAASPGGSITWTAGNQTDNDTNANSPGGRVDLVAGTSAKNAATSGGGGIGLTAGACSGAAGPGGDVNLLGGSNTNAAGTARGGALILDAGSVTAAGSSGTGGHITLTSGNAAGSGAGSGGAATIVAGNATSATGSGSGGAASLTAGNAAGSGAGSGGAASVTAGNTTAAGGSGSGGAANLIAGSAAGSGAGAGGTVTITAGATTNAAGSGVGGSVNITAGAAAGSGNAGSITLQAGLSSTGTDGNINGFTHTEAAVRLRTQTGALGSENEQKTLVLVDFVATGSATVTVVTLDTIATNGRNTKIHIEITAVDDAQLGNQSATVIFQSAGRAAGTVTLFTANFSDKQVIGGGGSFSNNVNFQLGVSGDDVILQAVNSDPADATGNITIRWWRQEGGFTTV